MEENQMTFKCPVCRKGNVFLPEDKKGNPSCSYCGTAFFYQKGKEKYQITDKPTLVKFIPQYDFIRTRALGLISPGEWGKVAEGKFLESESKHIDSLKQEQEKIWNSSQIIITTTSNVEGVDIKEYKGIVGSQVMAGINMFKDAFAGLRNVIGGRSKKLQISMNQMRIQAIQELREEAYKIGANAVIGVKLDFDEYAEHMLMLSANGTAVVIE